MDEHAEPVADKRGAVTVDGVAIAWERWVRPASPRVLLVHGTSAHTAWWHHTVPWLADAYDVTAMDLSGHGDSGRRPSYDLRTWSQEVLAVVEGVCGGEALLVGHSIGGLVTGGAAAARPEAVVAMVLVDCIVSEPSGPGSQPPPLRTGAVYPTRTEALARYRLMPPQPVPDVRTLDYVAARSLQPADGGWTWKADPAVFGALTSPLTTELGRVRCPTTIVRGELSQLVPADASTVLAELLGRPVTQYDVPDAYHHVMIDQGGQFGRLLRRALDELSAPVPVDPS